MTDALFIALAISMLVTISALVAQGLREGGYYDE